MTITDSLEIAPQADWLFTVEEADSRSDEPIKCVNMLSCPHYDIANVPPSKDKLPIYGHMQVKILKDFKYDYPNVSLCYEKFMR